MSVTVTAVPFLLFSTIVPACITMVAGVVDAVQTGNNIDQSEKLHLSEEAIKKIFNRKFETVIVDKDTLIKTLVEHGANNVSETENSVSCDLEAFHLNFVKDNQEAPYGLVISYNEEKGLDELVENISSEYTTNAQEASYNKIKERLEAQKLTIESEEVLDDDSIVLTVNLE